MTSTALIALYHAQGGECFYCGRPTWLRAGGEGYQTAKKRLGCPTRTQLLTREATREHVVRKADGGANALHNYVMACRQCNCDRGAKPVLVHFAERRNAECRA